jgi:predicted HTH domain antitoxin
MMEAVFVENGLNTKETPLLTPGELQLVKMGIILPVMLDVLQRDMNRINQVELKLNVLFIISLSKVQDNVHAELMGLKEELRRRGIKIYEEIRVTEGLQARFKCRGYDHNLLLRWDKVRAEVLKKSSEYWGIELTNGG